MSSVIEHPSYFTSLPREYYVSDAIFEEELRKVFSRQWLYAGHVSLVPEPGDYYVRQVGPESLIIVRDDGGEVRAFFNVCRHRGSRICADDADGNAKQFVCPYHRWSYGRDGRLLGSPTSPDGVDFDYADWGLHEASCTTYFGSIFVFLADEQPQPLENILSPETDEDALRSVEPERTKLAHREVYEVEANWKALLENNCECHHCAGAHPSLGVACDYRAFYRHNGDERDSLSGAAQHFPLREGMQTFSVDGKWVSDKPLGTSQGEAFSTGFLLVPNFCGPVYFADHGVVLDVTPLSRDRTQLISEWYVHEDAVEGVDYEVERLIEVFHVTNLEDVALAEQNQKGINSMRFVPGPNSPSGEWFIKVALDTYLEMMAAD